MAQGGTFRSGFASGFAASFFSPGTEIGGDGAGGFTLRTTISGIVGGTASELGGGKFANGAISGAFVHMFNAEMHKYIRSLSVRQIAQVAKFKRYIQNMDLKTFNKTFGLNVSSKGEMNIYKLEIYNQLNPAIIKGAYDAATQAVKDIGGTRSSFAPIKTVYHLFGPDGELGYDFVKGTTTLRGVYEID